MPKEHCSSLHFLNGGAHTNSLITLYFALDKLHLIPCYFGKQTERQKFTIRRKGSLSVTEMGSKKKPNLCLLSENSSHIFKLALLMLAFV